MPNQDNKLTFIHYAQYFFYTVIVALLLYISNHVAGIIEHNSILKQNTERDIKLLNDLLEFEKNHAKEEFEKMQKIQELEELELIELNKLRKKR